MATQKIINANVQRLKTGLTIAHGNDSNSLVSNSPGPSIYSSPIKHEGVGVRDGNDTDKALSAGTFSYQEANKYVIKGTSQTLSGVAKTMISSPASDWGVRHAIHSTSGVQSALIITAGFVYNSGVYQTAPTISSDDFKLDNAVTSRSIPGELVILEGKLGVPSQLNYRLPT